MKFIRYYFKVHNFLNHVPRLLRTHLRLFFFSIPLILVFGCKDFDGFVITTQKAVLHPTSVTDKSFSGDSSDKSVLLFQASGWVEPDPYAVRIPSLYDGIVKEVYVLEGETVKIGQQLVSLIDDDALISLKLAQAELKEAKSRELEIASHLTLQKLSLEKAETQHLEKHELLTEYKDYLSRLESLPLGSIPSFDLNQSRYKTERMKFSSAIASTDVRMAQEKITLLLQSLESQKKATEWKRTLVEKALLDLNRTKIFSPMDGRILKLFARPGKRLMQKMDAPESSTAVTIYNDNELQVRIDVPLEEASKLFIGQQVEISCSILPDSMFLGQLTSILGEADFQRNTLQVKVKILNPDERLRPEMLCRAKFYSKEKIPDKSQISSPLGVFIPISLRPKDYQNGAELWIVGLDGKTAEIRKVIFGEEIINNYIKVLSGLNAGDQIIENPPKSLQPGDAVQLFKK